MKRAKLKTIWGFTLSLLIIVGVIFAVSVNAENDTSPKILAQNVAYTGDFGLLYAVSENAVAPVTLYVYDEVPNESSVAVGTYVANRTTPGEDSGLKDSSGTPIDAYIFKTAGVVAASMTDNFYIKAVGADGKESELKRYSVAEYL